MKMLFYENTENNGLSRVFTKLYLTVCRKSSQIICTFMYYVQQQPKPSKSKTWYFGDCSRY